MKDGINDVDFFNYFFRKLFYHCLSEHDEDNFKYTLFTSAKKWNFFTIKMNFDILFVIGNYM